MKLDQAVFMFMVILLITTETHGQRLVKISKKNGNVIIVKVADRSQLNRLNIVTFKGKETTAL